MHPRYRNSPMALTVRRPLPIVSMYTAINKCDRRSVGVCYMGFCSAGSRSDVLRTPVMDRRCRQHACTSAACVKSPRNKQYVAAIRTATLFIALFFFFLSLFLFFFFFSYGC
jgi:hypothetical protein